MGIGLLDLPDDVKLQIFLYLTPPDLITIRKTCTVLSELSKDHIVWILQCETHILSQEYPFPSHTLPLESMPTSRIEETTLRAYRLARRLQELVSVAKSPNNKVHVTHLPIFDIQQRLTDVRFLSIHGRSLLLTVSGDIWSVLTAWDITPGAGNARLCEWGIDGTRFGTVVLNTDPTSTATLALRIHGDTYDNKVLTLTPSFSFKVLASQPTLRMFPAALDGDVMALCDIATKTTLWNWRTSEYALLDENFASDVNYPLRAVFARASNTLLVARSKSLSVFAIPNLHQEQLPEAAVAQPPLAVHEFPFPGLDAIRLTPSKNDDKSFQILLRGTSNDPWMAHEDTHHLELYELSFNPDFDAASSTDGVPPYIFPPTLQARIPTVRSGRLYCRTIHLGEAGTALFIRPKSWDMLNALSSVGWDESDLQDGFGYASGTAQGGEPERDRLVLFFTPTSVFCPRERNKDYSDGTTMLYGAELVLDDTLRFGKRSWACLDYDEETGRVVLGSHGGEVLMLRLA